MRQVQPRGIHIKRELGKWWRWELSRGERQTATRTTCQSMNPSPPNSSSNAYQWLPVSPDYVFVSRITVLVPSYLNSLPRRPVLFVRTFAVQLDSFPLPLWVWQTHSSGIRPRNDWWRIILLSWINYQFQRQRISRRAKERLRPPQCNRQRASRAADVSACMLPLKIADLTVASSRTPPTP